MKLLRPCLLLLLSTAPVLADGPTLKDARQRWLRGNYEEARALYETLANDSGQRAAAAIGLSRTLQSEGQYDKALSAVEGLLTPTANHQPVALADLSGRKAELLYLRGRWQEAEQAAEQALKASPNHFLARWVRAQIYNDRADLKRADAEFRWFVRTYTERSDQEKDIKDPDELLLVGMAGAENARWHNLSDQFRVILTDVYGDALKNEKDFWPAECAAGMLLLEKYNRGEALDAFEKALTINPNAAEALVGKGLAALQRYDIKDAEQFVQRALMINPNLPEALCLRADIHLMAADLKAAGKDLEAARKVNPRDERTLGRIAACSLLAHDQKAFDALVKEVRQHDPKPGNFYQELAERLEERKQFEAAEKYYKTAITERPMLPWSQNSLGLLYMRMGREKEARDILDKAFKKDEFNVRVSNTLKVLRHLDKYQTLKTEHFELRFDPENDPRLATYMAGYLEDVYKDLAERFQYRPVGPILIEIFNNHEMFSGRTIALPDLHTIGACTGRVFAMVSPNGKGIRKPFNWARVVRHELVHIFNLEQTAFQVPHWFTEGLAVSNEGFPRPQAWNQLLMERVPSNELMNLDNIDLGFIRPRSPLDWHMAYCQSLLYVQFMREKYGANAIGDMLQAFKDGLTTSAALVKVCHIDKKSFEAEYHNYLEDVVRQLHARAPEKKMTYSELRRAFEAKPGDIDVAARLAEQCLLRRDKKEARKLVEDVLAKKAAHPLASFVKARLLRDAGEDDASLKLLQAALEKEHPHPKVLQDLGALYFEAQEFAKAAEVYELAHKVEPYESKWLVDLLRVYTQLGDKAKRIDVLKQLVPTDPDDLDQRKKLTELLLEASRYAEAERFARECLEIDVRDVEAQEALEKALEAQNKKEGLEKLRKLLSR